MAKRPIVLIHGYSDSGESFQRWKSELVKSGQYQESEVHVLSYRSLTNEISIKDIAEGFDRALRLNAALSKGQEFDAVVHSTGMLVIRSWLVQYGSAAAPLKHLIALAPATFGSPLAKKGRSFLGAVAKGSKNVFSPDFLEAGDEVLDGLELASAFTWDLAHRDLFGEKPFYGPNAKTPWVFVFCGNKTYSGIRSFVNEPGTDGTVRWAGCALDSRKFVVDLTTTKGSSTTMERASTQKNPNIDSPLVSVEELNHGTILTHPSAGLIKLVVSALDVETKEAYDQWMSDARKTSLPVQNGMDKFQQFIIRAVDERGDPIRDWNLQFYSVAGRRLKEFSLEVDRYTRDPSYRSFHVNLSKLDLTDPHLEFELRVITSTGTDYVGYNGLGSDTVQVSANGHPCSGIWESSFRVKQQLNAAMTLFYPFTTTLVELRLNREPTPFDSSRSNNVTSWDS